MGSLEFVREEYAKDYRVRRFWKLGLAAIFVHVVLDPLVTYVAVAVLQVGVESNPWLAQYLSGGGWEFAIIHLPLVVLVSTIFLAYTWLFTRSSDREATQLYLLSVVFWSVILVWGCLVVGNNLAVVLTGI